MSELPKAPVAYHFNVDTGVFAVEGKPSVKTRRGDYSKEPPVEATKKRTDNQAAKKKARRKAVTDLRAVDEKAAVGRRGGPDYTVTMINASKVLGDDELTPAILNKLFAPRRSSRKRG